MHTDVINILWSWSSIRMIQTDKPKQNILGDSNRNIHCLHTDIKIRI